MNFISRILVAIASPNLFYKLQELEADKRALKEMNTKMSMDIETLEAWVMLLKKSPAEGFNTMAVEYVTRVIPQAKRLTLNGVPLFDQPREVLLAILLNEVTAHYDNANPQSGVPMYRLALAPNDTFRFGSLVFEYR
jgi:hypothetical protein